MQFDKFDDLMTVKDIQTALHIGRNNAYRLIKDGHIKSFKIGRSIRIPKQYLIDFTHNICYNATVVNGLSHLEEDKYDGQP
jgi:excisionase family DNA binding protein